MKKLLAVSIAMLMLIGLVLPVMADDAEEAEQPVTALAAFMAISGEIVDVSDDEILIERANDEGKFRVGITEDTLIVDAESGTMTTIEDRDNDNIKAYVPSFWGMSEPPFAAASVVITNVEGLNAPNMFVVEAVDVTDDVAKITVANNTLIISVSNDVLSHAGLTREAMIVDKIQVGDTMLFWYGIVATSMPAQTTATKALWLHAGDYETPVTLPADLTDEDYETPVTLPADIGSLTPPATGEVTAVPPIFVGPIPGAGIIRDGIEFFPVREIATKLGYDVVWNADLARAELNVPGTARMVNMYPGQDRADVNRMMVTLSAATFIEDGVMYAPQDFFELIG